MIRRFSVTAAFIAFMSVALISGAEEMLQVRGSDTMVNLIQVMAESYMEKYPGKQVAVTGGGSGTGISGLRNRTVDIADASRDIKAREIIDSKAKGVDPVRTVMAIDCITIVVNESNPVEKLTTGQVGAIFKGDIANWK